MVFFYIRDQFVNTFQATAELIVFDYLILTMDPKDMSDKIATANSTFIPITDKPTEDNLLCLRECLTPILIYIPYNTSGVAHNL